MRYVARAARVVVGLAVLAFVVQRVGSDAFVRGLRATDIGTVGVAVVVTAAVTLACAWRWRLVAARLGLDLSTAGAVAAYYRSQLLNATLPGGVLGDAHRAVRHGTDNGALGRGVRAVVWERTVGQVVQVVLAALVLLASPWRGHVALPLGVAAAVAVVVGLVVRRWGRAAALRGEAGTVLGAGGAARIALASVISVAGHVTVFVVAAKSVGVSAPLDRLVPIALVVLVVAALPTNVAGWGPREGAAAWSFAATGLPASQGLAVSVVYGVVTLLAVLPGAGVLLLDRRPARPRLVRQVVARA